MEYLRGQEENISQYYTQIEFHMASFEIYEIFKPTRKVTIATDGEQYHSKDLWDSYSLMMMEQ